MAVGTRKGASSTKKVDNTVPTHSRDIPVRSREQASEGRNTPKETTDGSNPLFSCIKDVVNTITKLESLGLPKLQNPIPKCVVLGEQSTGKSSVIEAISGIRTPRSSGTCTRCPMLIQLKPSEDKNAAWNAKVTLRQEYAFDGLASTPRDPRRFDNWKQLDAPVTVNFGEADNLDDLEELIQSAQRATIHPLADHHIFLPGSTTSYENEHRTDFSPNVIGILVTHPSLSPLSLYDLPGIISRTEKKEGRFAVKVVRDLVCEYVSDPQSLVLVTCSFGNDIVNSNAMGIAEELDAEIRCIGVLTKPDRLDEGTSEELLHGIFNGESLELGHGYFVVKNLDQNEINEGDGHDEARIRETKFFHDHEPWATTFAQYSSRFGTPNLQAFLSNKLAEMMIQQLPNINNEILRLLMETDDEISRCPPPPDNPTKVICEILLRFSDDVRKDIECDFGHNAWEWQNTWKGLRSEFLQSLTEMAPKMVIRGAKDADIYDKVHGAIRGATKDDCIFIDDDDDDQPPTTEDRHASVQTPIPETPTKKRKVAEEAQFKTPMKGTPARPRPGAKPTPSKGANSPFGINTPLSANKNPHALRKVFRLDDVEQELDRKAFHKAPNDVEPRVVCEMMVNSMQNTQASINDFFKNFERNMKIHMRKLFLVHFNKWKASPLYNEALGLVDSMLAKNFAEQRASAQKNFRDEEEGPFISSDDQFHTEVNAKIKSYRNRRKEERIKMYKEAYVERHEKEVSPAEEKKLDSDRYINEEPYEKVVEAIAKTSTYYSIASRRLHDAICMRIVSKFFARLRYELRRTLEDGLGIMEVDDGHARARALLAEPERFVDKRKQLHDKRNALLQAQDILYTLKRKGEALDEEMTDVA